MAANDKCMFIWSLVYDLPFFCLDCVNLGGLVFAWCPLAFLTSRLLVDPCAPCNGFLFLFMSAHSSVHLARRGLCIEISSHPSWCLLCLGCMQWPYPEPTSQWPHSSPRAHGRLYHSDAGLCWTAMLTYRWLIFKYHDIGPWGSHIALCLLPFVPMLVLMQQCWCQWMKDNEKERWRKLNWQVCKKTYLLKKIHKQWKTLCHLSQPDKIGPHCHIYWSSKSGRLRLDSRAWPSPCEEPLGEKLNPQTRQKK